MDHLCPLPGSRGAYRPRHDIACPRLLAMADRRVLWFPEWLDYLRSRSKRARIVEDLEVILSRATEAEEFYLAPLVAKVSPA